MLALIDRRKGAEEEGGVGPGGAGAGASLHREDGGSARARGTAERSTEGVQHSARGKRVFLFSYPMVLFSYPMG